MIRLYGNLTLIRCKNRQKLRFIARDESNEMLPISRERAVRVLRRHRRAQQWKMSLRCERS